MTHAIAKTTVSDQQYSGQPRCGRRRQTSRRCNRCSGTPSAAMTLDVYAGLFAGRSRRCCGPARPRLHETQCGPNADSKGPEASSIKARCHSRIRPNRLLA